MTGCGLAAFGLGWAMAWAWQPLLETMRGTDVEMSTVYALMGGVAFVVSAALVGLVFHGSHVKYLLPIGCTWLFGTTMGPGRMLRLSNSRDVITLSVADALARIPPHVVDQWPLKAAFVAGAVALCAIFLLMRLALEGKSSRKATAVFLAIVTAAGMCMFLLRDAMVPDSEWKGRQGGYAEGFHETAKRITSTKAFLQSYQNEREAFSSGYTIHVWSNMPGKTLLYYASYRMGIGLEGIAKINTVLCALAAIPLFFVVKRLASAGVAAGACALFYMLPGLPWTFPALNATTALVALVGMWLVLICLDRRSLAWGLATGIYLALLFFYEPLPFVLTLMLVPYIVRAFRADAARTGVMFGGIAAGFAIFFAGLYLWSGLSIFTITVDTAKCAARFNAESGRTYWAYIFYNVGEFVHVIGGAVFMLWAFGAAGSVREMFARGGSFVHRFLFEPVAVPAVFVLSFSLMVLVLNVSGANRTEVGRLWLFIMPLAGASAVWGAEKYKLKAYMPALCALLCAAVVI
jgi:hypothetical protein